MAVRLLQPDGQSLLKILPEGGWGRFGFSALAGSGLGCQAQPHGRRLAGTHHQPIMRRDLGALLFWIHRALIALRDAGAAILVISEDLDELFQISDRLGALCSGRLSPLKDTAHTHLVEVGGWMAGQFDTPATPSFAHGASHVAIP